MVIGCLSTDTITVLNCLLRFNTIKNFLVALGNNYAEKQNFITYIM